MSDKIRMSYPEMGACAKSVATSADEARTILSNIEKEVQHLEEAWQGMAKSSFKSSYASCRKDFLRVPIILQNVGKTLTDVAETMKQAEVDAQQAINQSMNLSQ